MANVKVVDRSQKMLKILEAPILSTHTVHCLYNNSQLTLTGVMYCATKSSCGVRMVRATHGQSARPATRSIKPLLRWSFSFGAETGRWTSERPLTCRAQPAAARERLRRRCASSWAPRMRPRAQVPAALSPGCTCSGRAAAHAILQGVLCCWHTLRAKGSQSKSSIWSSSIRKHSCKQICMQEHQFGVAEERGHGQHLHSVSASGMGPKPSAQTPSPKKAPSCGST